MRLPTIAQFDFDLVQKRRNSKKINQKFVQLYIRLGWGAPGLGSSATPKRHMRTPVASYCDGSSPTKNKFNIEVNTWFTYQILN
jgi:hypothetical protein